MKLKSVEQLLAELETRKNSLDVELKDIQSQKKIIERLFPKEFNFKTKFQLENKVDLLVRFYELILKYNNQYSSIIKDQLSFMMKKQELSSNDDSVTVLATKLFDTLNEEGVDLSKMSDEINLELSEFEESEAIKEEDTSAALPANLEEAVQTINNALSSYEFERNNNNSGITTGGITEEEAVIIEEESKKDEAQKLNEKILKELKNDSSDKKDIKSSTAQILL